MQRILVMGSSGSGKSAFARWLSAITGIPTLSLDTPVWKLGRVESNRFEVRTRVAGSVRQRRWIMDGDYTASEGELRRASSDAVISFDLLPASVH